MFSSSVHWLVRRLVLFTPVDRLKLFFNDPFNLPAVEGVEVVAVPAISLEERLATPHTGQVSCPETNQPPCPVLSDTTLSRRTFYYLPQLLRFENLHY